MSKDLIWIDKRLIEKLKLLDGTETIKNEDIQQYINEFKDGIEQLGEDIDSNVLDIRVKAQRAREAYKNVVSTEIESICLLWEELDSKRYEAYDKIKIAEDRIKSITDDVYKLKKRINEIDFYGLNQLIEVVDKVSSMDDRQLNLLEKLFKNK